MDDRLERDVSNLQQILMQLSLASRRRLAHDLDSYNLTVAQYSALRALQRLPDGISMTELAGACHQVSATMTGIVDRLAERGLVTRKQDPNDRRAQLVSLTQKGLTIIIEIDVQQTNRISRVLVQLTPTERQEMLRLLTIYLETIQDDPKQPFGTNSK